MTTVVYDAMDRQVKVENLVRHVRRTLHESRSNVVFESAANGGFASEG